MHRCPSVSRKGQREGVYGVASARPSSLERRRDEHEICYSRCLRMPRSDRVRNMVLTVQVFDGHCRRGAAGFWGCTRVAGGEPPSKTTTGSSDRRLHKRMQGHRGIRGQCHSSMSSFPSIVHSSLSIVRDSGERRLAGSAHSHSILNARMPRPAV